MEDNFWTDELVNEYAVLLMQEARDSVKKILSGDNPLIGTLPSQFKKSKEQLLNKDYEIVSMTCSNGVVSIYDQNKHLYKDSHEYAAIYMEAEIGWVIHSVRRLSDGEVFTVGDMVCTESMPTTKIESFEIFENTIVVFGIWVHGMKGSMPLEYILKSKYRVLHISDDGVEMRQYDTEFYVDLEQDFEIVQSSTSVIVNPEFRINNKIFSTKEAAQQYVIDNKPCLSVNEVKEFLKTGTDILSCITKLAKQKINQ
jgi:hypothetical protein